MSKTWHKDDFIMIHGDSDAHDFQVETPEDIFSQDAMMEVQCVSCGLFFALSIWGDNKQVVVVDEGSGVCLEDTEEQWVVDNQ